MAAVELGVRDRVLNAAIELFAAQGYDATSVTQVTDRARVAKGGFYHHFASKQELLYAVYGDLITLQLERMQRILAREQSPVDTLRDLINDLVVTTAASAEQALVSFREISRLDGERGALLRTARRRYHDAMIELVSRGQAVGTFSTVASPETITFTIFGVINELPLWYRAGGRKRPDQIATELADLILAALRPPLESEPATARSTRLSNLEVLDS
jgi:AcrR family transcriptional regulator